VNLVPTLKLCRYPTDSCAPAHFDLSVCPSMSLASPAAPFHRRDPRGFAFYVTRPIRCIPEFLREAAAVSDHGYNYSIE